MSAFDLKNSERILDDFIGQYNVDGAKGIFVAELSTAVRQIRKNRKITKEQYAGILEILLKHQINEVDVGWLGCTDLFLQCIEEDRLVDEFPDELRDLRDKAEQILQGVPGRGELLIKITKLIEGEEEKNV